MLQCPCTLLPNYPLLFPQSTLSAISNPCLGFLHLTNCRWRRPIGAACSAASDGAGGAGRRSWAVSGADRREIGEGGPAGDRCGRRPRPAAAAVGRTAGRRTAVDRPTTARGGGGRSVEDTRRRTWEAAPVSCYAQRAGRSAATLFAGGGTVLMNSIFPGLLFTKFRTEDTDGLLTTRRRWR